MLPRPSARSGGGGWGRGKGAGGRRGLQSAPAAPPGGGAGALVLQTEWTLQPRQWCLAGTGFALARGFSGCGPTSLPVLTCPRGKTHQVTWAVTQWPGLERPPVLGARWRSGATAAG